MYLNFSRKSLAAIMLVIGVAASGANAYADKYYWSNQYTDRSKYPYDYKSICYFNKTRRRCTVMNSRGRYNLSKNNHVEILWEDGEVTTMRYLEPPKKGAKVLLNNDTPGIIQSSSYMNNVISFRIKSTTGNILRFQTSD